MGTLWSVVAERSRALDSLVLVLSECGFESNPGLALSKTLNHNCFVLRMGHKAVGPVCCVMHVTEHRTPLQKISHWKIILSHGVLL